MGEHAAITSKQWGVSREDQDALALESHRRLAAAYDRGFFDDLLTPYLGLTRDQNLRADTSLERLAALKPAFRPGGSVTAGNSSTLNDGASALLLMSEQALRASGATPLARYVSSASVGVDPRYMGVGPVPASRKALARAGWSPDSVDLVELNEAFAAQALACLRDL